MYRSAGFDKSLAGIWAILTGLAGPGSFPLENAVHLQLPQRRITFPRRTLVMGIVNVNDDSFCGDGSLDLEDVVRQSVGRICEGADIIDVGAESARTNRAAVSVEEEVRRFRAFFARWPEIVAKAKPRDDQQIWPPILSVNTWRPEVVKQVLDCKSVELINDMGGLPDPRNAEQCAQAGAALLVMHSVGEPKVPHTHQQWDDVMGSMETFFDEKIGRAKAAGMAEEALVLDPGIDFAKQRDDNLTVLRELARLQRFGRPVLMPASRKTVIGEVLGLDDPRDRDAGTIACVVASMRRGAHIVRVHDVAGVWAAVVTTQAVVLPLRS